MIRLDPSRRAEAVEAGWVAYAERVPTLEVAYRREVARWAAIAVCADNEVIGALLERDGVIHLGIVPAWRGRWASRRVIREMLHHGTRTVYSPELGDDEAFLERVRRIACHS